MPYKVIECLRVANSMDKHARNTGLKYSAIDFFIIFYNPEEFNFHLTNTQFMCCKRHRHLDFVTNLNIYKTVYLEFEKNMLSKKEETGCKSRS